MLALIALDLKGVNFGKKRPIRSSPKNTRARISHLFRAIDASALAGRDECLWRGTC
jgi:hypothetical protein